MYRIANNNKQLILHEATPLEEQLDEQPPLFISIKELHDMCIPENQVTTKLHRTMFP